MIIMNFMGLRLELINLAQIGSFAWSAFSGASIIKHNAESKNEIRIAIETTLADQYISLYHHTK